MRADETPADDEMTVIAREGWWRVVTQGGNEHWMPNDPSGQLNGAWEGAEVQGPFIPASHLQGAVSLTPEEIKGLRMALRWGVPDPEPEEIRSARLKLEDAERRAGGSRP